MWYGTPTPAMENAVQSAETVVKVILKTVPGVMLGLRSRGRRSGWGNTY